MRGRASCYTVSMRVLLLLSILLATSLTSSGAGAQNYRCQPTPPDAEGPFYRPGAPVRSQIGTGYLLMGEVKSATDCAPIGGARIELWMTGPAGGYDDRWRATTFARGDGRYFFVSHYPAPYGSRPPHIHILVNAPGFRELITQHYPQPGSGEAIFDLVLLPARGQR